MQFTAKRFDNLHSKGPLVCPLRSKMNNPDCEHPFFTRTMYSNNRQNKQNSDQCPRLEWALLQVLEMWSTGSLSN